jgi:hypothetical protein
MMKAVSTSETLVNFYQSTRRNFSDDNLHTVSREDINISQRYYYICGYLELVMELHGECRSVHARRDACWSIRESDTAAGRRRRLERGRKINEENRTSHPFSKEERKHQMMGFTFGLLKDEKETL